MTRHDRGILECLRTGVPKGAKLLVAVSGGVDSVCLLLALVELAAELKLSIKVVHFDHGLRIESADDASWVSELAAGLGIDCFVGRSEGPVPETNIEAWGREQRYRYFGKIKLTSGADWIVTAHHRGDRVESFLIGTLRNRQYRGLAAIDERRGLLRPLLAVSKALLVEFVEARGRTFRPDATNQDTDFLRNWIRGKLLPELVSEIGAGVEDALARQAEAHEQDQQALDQLASSIAAQLVNFEVLSRSWLREVRNLLAGTPKAVSWRVIEQLFTVPAGMVLGRFHCLRLLDFICGDAQAISMPADLTIRRKNGGLEVLQSAKK